MRVSSTVLLHVPELQHLEIRGVSRHPNPSSSGSDTATRARSYSQLPALLEFLSKSVQAPGTLVDFTLCNLTTLEDCRQIFTSVIFAVSLSFDVSSSDSHLRSGRLLNGL